MAGDPRLRSLLLRGLASSALGLVAVLIALVLVYRTEWGTTALQGIQERANPAYLVVAFGFMSATFGFMGLRWRALMPEKVQPPALALTAILLAGLLLNYALPGPAGDVAAAWFVHRRYGVAFPSALASGVAARVIGLATAAGVAGLVWVGVTLPVPEGFRAWLAATAVLVGVAGGGLLAVALLPDLAQRLVLGTLHALHRRLGLAALLKLEPGVRRLTEALVEVASRGKGAYGRAAGWACAGHLSVTTGIALCCWSFGAYPDPAGLLFTYTLTTAGAVALFAFPGSQISWDAGFVALLVGACALSLPDALVVAAVVRLQQIVLQAIGAAALTWVWGGELTLPQDSSPPPSVPAP